MFFDSETTRDNDGQLANVSSKANSNATSRTYANAFVYAASGAIQSMRLGNGRFESTVFNSRLQPTQIALGTSANNTSLLKLNYDYGTTDNNGNVKSQTITVSGMSYPLVQTYSYDSLNRLTSAEEKSNNITQWKQTFTFDRYGNRSFDSANTTTFPTGCPTSVCNPLFNQSNNRMSDNQGYEYDLAGNVTKDATDKRFIYDAENKQTSFGTNGSSTNGGSYFYDGDGRRVKKVVGTETTIFVYNASGQLVAEYSTTTVQNPTISYLTSDNLGTPRINTNASGQVTARHDYMPFGEEIIGLGGRATQQGYSVPDGVRQQFTSKERDIESGLDYFLARYYSSTTGRFTSPDPLYYTASRPNDPQQFNLYSYVRNSPLSLIDPDGKDGVLVADTPEARAEAEKQLKRLAPGTKVDANGKIHKPGFFRRLINNLTGHGAGTKLVSRIVDSKNVTLIKAMETDKSISPSGIASSEMTDFYKQQSGCAAVKCDYLIEFNTKYEGESHDRMPDGSIKAQPFDLGVALGHELIHVDIFNHFGTGFSTRDDFANHYYMEDGKVKVEKDLAGEFLTVGLPFEYKGTQKNVPKSWDITENQLRKELMKTPRPRATYK